MNEIIAEIQKNIDDIIKAGEQNTYKVGMITGLEIAQKCVEHHVKRGRWIKREGFWNKNTVKCSLCGNYLDMDAVNGGRSDANFCPNCGAQMVNENE